MAQHNELGREGENEACAYLIERDIHILERNWHGRDCEVDIIADDYGEVIFIEVKTRTTLNDELPEDAVDGYRMYRLSRAAEEYLNANHLEKYPFRFDIIAIDLTVAPCRLRHIIDAFPLKPKKRRSNSKL